MSAAASWSRSAAASGSPRCWRSPAPAWSRSGPPTAPARPTTSTRSAADAGLVLKVHQSNYRITGFTEAVDVAALAALGAAGGRRPRAPACSTPPARGWRTGRRRGCADEPAARQTLEAGAALVTFSGDKLLGGPQAGVIAGRADLVAACARHPLARALRPGGLVLAALQDDGARLPATGDGDAIPFWRMAARPVGRRCAARAEALGVGEVVDCASVAGGGTAARRRDPLGRRGRSTATAAPALRAAPVPVIARVDDGPHGAATCARSTRPDDDRGRARAGPSAEG